MADEALKEGLREVVSWAKTVGWAEQRPWKEMMQLKLAKDMVILKKRMYTNALYYRTNYAIVCAALCAWTL